MAENDDAPQSPAADASTGTTAEQAAQTTAQQPVTEPPAPARAATRFRDTLWTFRSVVAVAIATFLIGGVGGALVMAAADDDGPDRVRVGFMRGPGDDGGYWRGPFRHDGPDGDGPRWRWDDDAPRPDLGRPDAPSTPTPSAPQSGSTG